MRGYEGNIYRLPIDRRAVQQGNAETILSAGASLISAARMDRRERTPLPPILIADQHLVATRQVSGFSLECSLGQEQSYLSLVHPKGYDVGRTSIVNKILGKRLKMVIQFTTTDGYEGHGFGTALGLLTNDLIEQYLKQYSKNMNVIYAYLEDWSHGATIGVDRHKWTSYIARELGFSDDPDLLAHYGEPERAADAFMKVYKTL